MSWISVKEEQDIAVFAINFTVNIIHYQQDGASSMVMLGVKFFYVTEVMDFKGLDSHILYIILQILHLAMTS